VKRLINVCTYSTILMLICPLRIANAEVVAAYYNYLEVLLYYPFIDLCLLLSCGLGFVLGRKRTQANADYTDAHMDLKEEMERKISALRQQLEEIKVKHNL